jgi:alkylhydroperoxidase family enzyme
MTWLPRTAAETAKLDGVLGLCPELHQRYRDFRALLDQHWPSDHALLNACHARVAALLSAEAEPLDDAVSGVERACLMFTDKFVLDPHGVTDDDAAAVVAHLGEAGMIAFVQTLALFDGFARFHAILDIGEQ